MIRALILLAALVSARAFAVEPLEMIRHEDPDYGFYQAVADLDQKMLNERLISIYSNFNLFGVEGRVVPLADGSPSNPLNLVVQVNGRLFYVDALLSSVDNFKIRRRWRNNPEPGVYLRVEGYRYNPEEDTADKLQLWIKIATPEGRALSSLKLFEGNYDLGDHSE